MHEIDIANLEFIHPMLRGIAGEIEEKFGQRVITSLYRIGDSGVHGTLPLRGIDFRFDSDSYKIQAFVNDNWTYDPERPSMVACMVHDVGGGVHVHLQVHPNTVRTV